jgi:hypothetical protein
MIYNVNQDRVAINVSGNIDFNPKSEEIKKITAY